MQCKKCGSTMMERHAKAIVCANCGEIVLKIPFPDHLNQENKFEEVEKWLEKLERYGKKS